MTDAQKKQLIQRYNELIEKSFSSYRQKDYTNTISYRMQAVELLKTLNTLGYEVIFDYEEVHIVAIYKVA